jgi:hypothetical protein
MKESLHFAGFASTLRLNATVPLHRQSGDLETIGIISPVIAAVS